MSRKTWAELVKVKAEKGFDVLEQAIRYAVFDEGNPKNNRGTTTVHVSSKLKERLKREIDSSEHSTFESFIASKIAERV